MAIKIYSGRPGSGKSYNSVANIIIPSLEAGRTVVTNVVLNKAVIFDKYPNANLITIPFALTHEQAPEYVNLELYPPGSVFVLDEGAKLFPTGSKVTNIPSSLLQFFTEHRHSVGRDGYAAEIFVLCQDSSQLAKFIRDLVDTTYHHVKLDKHGFANRFRVDIYDGCVSGQTTRAEPVTSALGSYKPGIFAFYKSHTRSSSEADTALEISPDKRDNHLHIYAYSAAAVPAVLLLVWFAYSTLMDVFGGASEVSDELPEVPVNQPVQGISAPANVAEAPLSRSRVDPAPLSEDWRLSGVIVSRGKVKIIIDSDDRSRMLDAVRYCDYDRDLSEWYCTLNGQIVASYTGPVWNPDDDTDDIIPFTD